MLRELTRQDEADTGSGTLELEDRIGFSFRVMWEPYEVWISREEMVDFLLYAASLEASVATRSKMSVAR